MRDRKGNVGIIVSANTRGGTLSASLSKYKSKTNAPTIYHQKGTSAQIGGSIDIGASLGLEYVVFPDSTTNMFIKGQLFLPVLEFHAFRQKYMERWVIRGCMDLIFTMK